MIAKAYQRSSNYDGNAALKLAPAEPVLQKVRKSQRKQVEREEKRQEEHSPKLPNPSQTMEKAQEKVQHAVWNAAPAVVIVVLVVAAVVIITLASYANLVIINDQRVELREQLDHLQTEETKLMAQYELAYDLQEIEAQMLASGQMTKIQNWQTYTLELSEPDVVEYYQESDFKEQIGSFIENLETALREYF